MGTEIDLIVGLGNPGPEYQATRHNAGFWFADLLAREHGARFAKERKLKGETAEVRIAGRRVRLLKPMTHMNLSGESVQAAVSYYKIPIEHVLVAYDELDFPPGRVQLKFDGSGAGHNGVGSVIEHLGAKFWRLRFGVGHPRNRAQASSGRREVIDHVLERATPEEEAEILATIGDAVKLVPAIVEEGAERVKNRLHRKKPAADSKESE
jgi:peptidyl-tRNA hydrolase, PTH1 family